MKLSLQNIDRAVVGPTVKGYPYAQAELPIGAIGRQGWNILRHDVAIPAALIKSAALAHNLQWMRSMTRACGVDICPHGKTTMSPQLFRMQLDHGAWGITAATVGHVRTYREYGVSRIILANELVGHAALDYVLNEIETDPALDFYCLIDSAENLKQIAEVMRLRNGGRPLQLLLEVGFTGGRTGVRSASAALALAQDIKRASPHVVLRGIETFEGVHSEDSDVSRLLDDVCTIAEECDRQDLFGPGEVIITAGGSAYFDLVAARAAQLSLKREKRIVLRSGCYITHDHGMYQRAFENLLARSPVARSIGGGLVPAFEVWGIVSSTPEPNLAIVNVGKRDASHDAGLPVPLATSRNGARPIALADAVVTRLMDQHAFVQQGEPVLRIGDLVSFGISHPCTTFDKWGLIYLVDETYDVVCAVRTFFT